MNKVTMVSAILAIALGTTALTTVNARELRLGHGMPEDNAQHLGLQAFAEEVKRLSNGDLTVSIYPNGQLGSEREMAEQTVTGALDLCKISGMLAETFEPKYGIMSIPYLFRDYDHVKAFINSDIPEKYFFQESADRGVVGLMLISAGTRNFYTKKPIKTPDDLSGMKMRVPESEMAMRMVKALGGQPTPVPWSEIYSALQQNIVDGAENSISAYVEQRHCEIDNYYNLDEHTMTPDVVFISDLTWSTLSPEEQQILKQAAKVGVKEEISQWDKKDKENLEKAKKLGVNFIEVDKAAFQEKTKSILEEERKKEGYSDIINAILSL